MKQWELPDGHYLLQGVASWPTNSPSHIRLPNGETLHHASAYYLVTPEGRVINDYPAPSAYSLEDILYIYDIHVVTDGQLLKFVWQQQWGYGEIIEAEVVGLTGLVERAPEELPFDPAPVRYR